MPTLEEINEVAPETPVFILHLYDRALLNAAALRAVGYTKDTPDPDRWRNTARPLWQSDWHVDRPAQCEHSLFHARQRSSS